MSCGGEQRKHPDDEEMVWHHSFHLCQPDGLYPDSSYHLLVAEGEEELPNYFGFFGSKFVEHDDSAQQECDPGSDNEGEKSL